MVESGEERAVITGDLVHHPVQFVEPDVPSLADLDGHGPYAGELLAQITPLRFTWSGR
ncbi:hypothetical protein OG730_06160 [Streptomyces sp. NBC_01298]|uniref:hypothetical protein n=1 Tax=Streptomyces sp. NBC_01298 TaxID=2903817 RepID=UPI002E0D6AE7|nr:hypothetical protein OG730_06160 [Streptomyces sp. NBC_01298]